VALQFTILLGLKAGWPGVYKHSLTLISHLNMLLSLCSAVSNCLNTAS
jgi:hypothetical protein